MFCIGLDTHKDYTTAVVLDDRSGHEVWNGSFPSTFRAAKMALEPYLVRGTKIALEPTGCFYPLYDGLSTLEEIEVLVVNTVKLEKPAIKTDSRDALRIAHLLRMNELPVSFVPNHALRYQRELCVQRERLVHTCTQCKNRIHAILQKEGRTTIACGVFTKKGRTQLQELCKIISRREELEDELNLLEIFERKLAHVDEKIHHCIEQDEVLKKQVELIDSIPGFAETFAFLCVSELGPITRFHSPKSLVAYAGLHPYVESSGGHTRLGKMCRLGRRLFRTALVEAAHSAGRTKTPLGEYYRHKAKQKKSNQAAAVALANKLARLLYEVLTKKQQYHLR